MLSGTMELLDEDLREGGDLTDAQEQVTSARRELRRLSVLASELLDLSRLDAAVLLRSEPVELGEIARAVAAEFELHASERGTSLEVESPGPCWALADPAACARVVRILIDNALRYAPAGEPILVSTSHRHDTVIVRVADRGPGVPPEEREPHLRALPPRQGDERGQRLRARARHRPRARRAHGRHARPRGLRSRRAVRADAAR